MNAPTIDYQKLFLEAVRLMKGARDAQREFYKASSKSRERWAWQQKAMQFEKEQDEFLQQIEQGQARLF